MVNFWKNYKSHAPIVFMLGSTLTLFKSMCKNKNLIRINIDYYMTRKFMNFFLNILEDVINMAFKYFFLNIYLNISFTYVQKRESILLIIIQ